MLTGYHPGIGFLYNLIGRLLLVEVGRQFPVLLVGYSNYSGNTTFERPLLPFRSDLSIYLVCCDSDITSETTYISAGYVQSEKQKGKIIPLLKTLKKERNSQ